MKKQNGISLLIKTLLPQRTVLAVPLSFALFACDAISETRPPIEEELQTAGVIFTKLTFSNFGDEECHEDEEDECEHDFDDEECDEDEDECEHGFDDEECDENEDECEHDFDDEECDEDEDECEHDFDDEECDEDEDECEHDFDDEECDEDEDECEHDFDDEECDEDEDECEHDFDDEECDEDEEELCELLETGVTSSYVNPNPLPNMEIIPVDKVSANRASRFLNQATLGANYPTVTQVAAIGEAQWLEQQFQQPIGYLFPYTDFLLKEVEEQDEDYELLGSPVKFHMHAWWTQAMTSPDLVRQRVAMALSEIFVVSSNVETIGESPYAVTHYYDTLLKHSFGNFRDLLKGISLNPAMGVYLSHLNNEKVNPEMGTFPDENYAREVMQLFSIGLFELNLDGSRKKDDQGQDIATYGQDEIREFAKIFTGLAIESEDEGFGVGVCCNGQFYTHAAEMKPLKMYDAFHSQGEKRLLNGMIVPAGQTGMQDIDAAIDNLFNHPNVGPFIGKQLIQRLVKSNPSPEYIQRVATAFNGNEDTPRGDMKAMLRAILLDPEARSVADNNIAEGRLREPFLRLLRLARIFNATTDNRTYAAEGYDVSGQIQQYVLYAPSVFNFFQPNYTPNGDIKEAGLVAPEFQITNAVTIIEIKNLIQFWLETGRFDDPVGFIPPETVSFSEEIALAEDTEALLDRLDTLMTYGTLSSNTKDVIRKAIENETELEFKVKKAVYLMAVSPDFAVAL